MPESLRIWKWLVWGWTVDYLRKLWMRFVQKRHELIRHPNVITTLVWQSSGSQFQYQSAPCLLAVESRKMFGCQWRTFIYSKISPWSNIQIKAFKSAPSVCKQPKDFELSWCLWNDYHAEAAMKYGIEGDPEILSVYKTKAPGLWSLLLLHRGKEVRWGGPGARECNWCITVKEFKISLILVHAPCPASSKPALSCLKMQGNEK